MNEVPLSNCTFNAKALDEGVIQFNADDGFVVELASYGQGMARLQVHNDSTHPKPPQDNVIPSMEKKKDRITLKSSSENRFEFSAPGLEIVAEISGHGNVGFELYNKSGTLIHKDLVDRSYTAESHGLCHYSKLHPDAIHVGLGEKGAPFDLTGRKFELAGRDALGYDSWSTDPLYKHIPMLMVLGKGGGWAFGEFSTSNSNGQFNLGNEIDANWTSYKIHRQDWGGLDKFFFSADSLQELVGMYASIVSFPALPSRHWLGYLASSMGYADVDNAQEVIAKFPQECLDHDIPCSVFHLSSGYTVTETEPPRRDVFNMNTKRCPDFPGLCRLLHEHGYQISANIKPYVSVQHHDYDKLKKAGALFTNPRTKDAVLTRVWVTVTPFGNLDGSWVDMTAEAGRNWWQENVENLLKLGVDHAWNDNNEYNLHNDNFICKFENVVDQNGAKNLPVGLAGRMINTQLMAKASHDASLNVRPDKRPFVLTRSANAGTMRYAGSSWSGDNRTCWPTIKGNSLMGLNTGLSLIQSSGHDVGGFAGPAPTPEMFLRWVQLNIFTPRFCIHSVAIAERVTEPWMYPEILPLIRESIKRRYELIPYLYSLHWDSHLHAYPLNRWIGWGKYEKDPNVWKDEVINSGDFWLGDSLIVAGVWGPGDKTREVYLPKSADGDDEYYNLNASSPDNSLYKGGNFVTVDTPQEHIGLFAKVGTAVPIGKPRVTVTLKERMDESTPDVVKPGRGVEYDDWRGIEIFPPKSSKGQHEFQWTEDDGESSNPDPTTFSVVYSVEGDSIAVECKRIKGGSFNPLWADSIDVILPKFDARSVKGGKKVDDYRGRSCYRIPVTN